MIISILPVGKKVTNQWPYGIHFVVTYDENGEIISCRFSFLVVIL